MGVGGPAPPFAVLLGPALAVLCQPLGVLLGSRAAQVRGHVQGTEGSAQHLPALMQGVIRFALKFSPLKRGKQKDGKAS
jgi:hypothetical protein